MTKQEEIREGLTLLMSECYSKDGSKLHSVFQPQKFLNKLFPYLHRKNVVIKVDRLLPFVSSDYELSQNEVYVSVGNEALNEQGYEAVEPFIKDK